MSKKNGSAALLRGGDKPIIAQLDQKKGGVNTVIMTNFKCEQNQVPTQSANGSTVPLVDNRRADPEVGDYDPFQHRNVAHPTSDLDTLIHLLKGALGSGILAMPLAFSHAGLFFGLICILFIGIVCTYCVHILVKCAHVIYHRQKVSSLSFDEVAEAAFLSGPKAFHPWAKFAKAMINFFLVVDLLGCCCVYVLFVSKNLKQVVDAYVEETYHYDVRFYMLALLPLLILMIMIRNLKYLSPLSMIANIFVAVGIGITFYYIFDDLPSLNSRPHFGSITTLPSFFGTAIFALEGIGVIMPLENNMKNPTHFIGCPGVLNIGMFFAVLLYSSVGFFGYLKYGDDVKIGSISLNLPNEPLAQSVKLMIAVAIFFTYALQFYVPMEIIWKAVKNNFQRKALAEYSIRFSLVTLTVVLAILIPNLGAFISLVGAVCLSMLGLIFPSIIELVTFYEDPGLGRWRWRLWKNMFLILFGLLGFVTGTYVSVEEIIQVEGLNTKTSEHSKKNSIYSSKGTV